ncbi:MAG TPA: DUF3618 domain-containing protein [Pyrinomonadaceae bacterium]|nr:DUF3618 domain-containing protein [Pyrinomonadaceae bacterium]
MGEATNQITAAADSDESRTTSTFADDYDENTEQLRADIEDTRADMSQTINEIQERLSPEVLMDQVKETVREATIGKVETFVGQVGETLSEVTEPAREIAGRAGIAIKEVGTTVADKLYKNPIPVALIGLGVGMLVIRNFRGSSYSDSTPSRRSLQGRGSNYELGDVGRRQQTYEGGSSTLNSVKETASDLASRSTDALSNLASKSTDALSDLGSKAKDGASAVSTRFADLMRTNPLAVGAMAIAAGTAVGLVLPSTRLETEYIGETGERLVDRVEDAARDALGKVQDAAKQMTTEGQQPRA